MAKTSEKSAAKKPTKPRKPAAKKATVKVEEVPHTLTQEDLEMNPELSEQGLEAGEVINIPTTEAPKEEVIDTVQDPNTVSAAETPKEEKPKKEKAKVDHAVIAAFEAICVSQRQTRASIIEQAYRHFKGKAVLVEGQNPREVYFQLGDIRIPEAGIFVIG